MTVPEGTHMRWLLALGLSAALLAGCASNDSEPDVADDTDTDSDDGAEEQPTEDDTADDGGAQDPGQPDPDEDGADEDAADGEGASAGAVEVEIGDFFFDDDELSIEDGDTVTWTHEGDITHNVTARDESFVSDNLAAGDTFTHTFDAAGSFEYVCTLHGQMTATVDVS
jgi:plastocyanin